jgi:hypothetical protein
MGCYPDLYNYLFGVMKPEIIALHRTLFLVLIGLFEALLVTSILVLWSVGPRWINLLEDAAGISGAFAVLGLLVLWWVLCRGAPRLARISLLSALAGIAVVLVQLPAFFGARTNYAKNACVNNLRQIDGAKQQWILEYHKSTNDIVAWADIRPYLRGTLACPNGGTYILGRLDQLPKCSLGVSSHSLPQ